MDQIWRPKNSPGVLTEHCDPGNHSYSLTNAHTCPRVYKVVYRRSCFHIFSQSKPTTFVCINGCTCEVSVQLYVVVCKYTSAHTIIIQCHTSITLFMYLTAYSYFCINHLVLTWWLESEVFLRWWLASACGRVGGSLEENSLSVWTLSGCLWFYRRPLRWSYLTHRFVWFCMLCEMLFDDVFSMKIPEYHYFFRLCLQTQVVTS